jgi:hypothetical protein
MADAASGLTVVAFSWAGLAAVALAEAGSGAGGIPTRVGPFQLEAETWTRHIRLQHAVIGCATPSNNMRSMRS